MNIVAIQTLTDFIMWCTIINGGLLLLWTGMFMIAPGLVYRTQSRFFAINEENFTVIFYGFLGVFKIFYIFFNVVPFLALLIIG